MQPMPVEPLDKTEALKAIRTLAKTARERDDIYMVDRLLGEIEGVIVNALPRKTLVKLP
jgi:ribosomal protein S7